MGWGECCRPGLGWGAGARPALHCVSVLPLPRTALAPGNIAALLSLPSLVGLALYAGLHDHVAADGAVVHHNVPGPQRHGAAQGAERGARGRLEGWCEGGRGAPEGRQQAGRQQHRAGATNLHFLICRVEWGVWGRADRGEGQPGQTEGMQNGRQHTSKRLPGAVSWAVGAAAGAAAAALPPPPPERAFCSSILAHKKRKRFCSHNDFKSFVQF